MAARVQLAQSPASWCMLATCHKLPLLNDPLLSSTVCCVQAPLISSVMFAPPQVGGPAFVERSSKLVNGRGVTFSDDIVQQARRGLAWHACT